MPATVGKRYVLHNQLGEGGMGAVFQATDRLALSEVERTVALKRVTTSTEELEFASKADLNHESATQMRLALANEFKVLASLRHPNIISVLDYGFDEAKQPYFAMNLLNNPQTMLDAGQNQPLAVKIDLLLAVLQALAYLHHRHIIHRDLKPGNIMVVRSEMPDTNHQVKVLDFGLSVTSSRNVDDMTDTTAGTLPYMAPELFQGESATMVSDLYAVGIMAYELFAGCHPFEADNIGLLLNNILFKPVDLSQLNVNAEIAIVIGQLLSKDPHERLSNAHDVITALCNAAKRPLPEEALEIRESFLQAAQFVGRHDEFTVLLTALAQMIAGKGGAWLLGGESGIGKSRMLDELRTNALVEGALVLRGQAVSEGSSPYQMWRETLRWLVLMSTIEPADAGILKTLVPDIDSLVEYDVSDPPPLDPQAVQNRLLTIVSRMLGEQTQPILILLEDLHWAGSESLVLLDHLSRIAADSSVLIVASFRNDEYPDLPARLPKMELLKLLRLTKDAIGELSEAMLGESGKQSQIIELLQRETEGNIFFAVEVMRVLAEEAGQLSQVGQVPLPRKVLAGGIQQIIQRRLHRLPQDLRPLIQLAAIAGRELDLKLIRSVYQSTDLDQDLARCANAAVLEINENRWRFSHDKLRDGVVAEIPAGKRQELHRQIAQAIETVYPGIPEQYAALAHHWHMVKDAEKERHYAALAGEVALRNSANLDAARLFSRALELIGLMPDTPERMQQELTLQINLGVVLLATKGYTAPEVKKSWVRAHELARQLGYPPQLFQVLWGLWSFYIVQANLQQAKELADQILARAESSEDNVQLLVAHWVLGVTLWGQGKFESALIHLGQGISRYDSQKHRTLGFLFGQDPGVTCLIFSAHCLWPLGYPEQAQEHVHRAVALAQEVEHPFSEAFAKTTSIVMHSRCQDSEAALREIPALVSLSTEHNFPLWIAWATSIKGWAMTRNGNSSEGLAQVDQGIAIIQAIGAQIELQYGLTLQALTYGQAGLVNEGLEIIDGALARLESGESQDRSSEAELHRVKGELQLLLGSFEAEVSFQRAITIAQKQNAKMWELRATVSLCRLWKDQGKLAEAQEKLLTVHNWFSEGLDTVDLKVAANLLDELA